MAPSAWAWCLGRAKSLRQPMARTSRLQIWREIERLNSSHSHSPRSHRRQRQAVRMGEQPGLAWRFAGDQSRRPLSVEAQHPVADDLQGDITKPGRLGARTTVIDHRERQPAPRLGRILVLPRKSAKPRSGEASTRGNGPGHEEVPLLATLNHTAPASGNS